MSKLSTRPDFTNTEIQDTDEFWINVDNLDTTFTSQKMTGLQLKSLLTGSPLVENVVFIDQNTPTTVGVVFDPNTPATIDTLYISSTNGSTWIWNGTAYVTYSIPSTSSTPFYFNDTTIDAGSNKNAMIYRNGAIGATSFNTKKGLTYTDASDFNKWWKVFEYSLASNYNGDSFKLQMNEYHTYDGGGKSVIFNILLKRQDPSNYLTVNIESGLSSFNLANFDILYNSTTKILSFYYKITTDFTYTNWLILNARATATIDIVWSNTLIGASLSGEVNNTLTSKTITLNKVNGAYTLPSTAPTIGQVIGYSSSGVSDWVNSSTAKVQTVTSSATVTPLSTNDLVTITAQAVGLTLANPTGTFTEGQALMIRIKDNGTARTIAFDTNYRAIGVTLPTTTVISKTMYVGVIYNATDGKWDILGAPTQV